MDRKSIMGSPPLYSYTCLRINITTMIIHVYLEWPYDISTSGAIVEIVVQCGWYLANATGVIVHGEYFIAESLRQVQPVHFLS